MALTLRYNGKARHFLYAYNSPHAAHSAQIFKHGAIKMSAKTKAMLTTAAIAFAVIVVDKQLGLSTKAAKMIPGGAV